MYAEFTAALTHSCLYLTVQGFFVYNLPCRNAQFIIGFVLL